MLYVEKTQYVKSLKGNTVTVTTRKINESVKEKLIEHDAIHVIFIVTAAAVSFTVIASVSF